MSAASARTGTDKTRVATSGGGPFLTDAYLLLYNGACAVGWNLTLYKIGGAILEGGDVRDAVQATHDYVAALQLVSTLELVHAFVGLVKSNPMNVFMQVLGRDLALFSVVTAFPPVRDSPWVLLMFTAWATSEVIRYPFYALNIAGMCPPVLQWLRYSSFVLLYPLGFAGELGTWIVGLPHIKAVGLPGVPGLPEGSSIYVLYAYIVFAFAIGAPKLYMHMLRQRKKQLQGGGKVKAS
ncbi:unnamed protein product [Ectocarpus sp. 12 AP-2014]